MKKTLLLIAGFGMLSLGAAELLVNGSFEIPHKQQQIGKTWNPKMVDAWNVCLNSGWSKVRAEWSNDAFDGRKAIKVNAVDRNTFVSIWQDVECTPGNYLASMYFKSPTKVCGYFRIYFFGPDGKMQKKYLMPGYPAKPEWGRFEARFAVPQGVKKIRFCVEMVGNRAAGETISFDKIELQKLPDTKK